MCVWALSENNKKWSKCGHSSGIYLGSKSKKHLRGESLVNNTPLGHYIVHVCTFVSTMALGSIMAPILPFSVSYYRIAFSFLQDCILNLPKERLVVIGSNIFFISKAHIPLQTGFTLGNQRMK